MAFDTILVVMGVSGSGKTTVAVMLAEALGIDFLEGDDLHPKQNVEKMKSGTPLTDDDRWPWLAAIAQRIDDWRADGQGGVVTCSALKRAYRDILIGERPNVRLVYLKGSHQLIHHRMAARRGHFMPVGLLANQFTVLQEPGPDERPIVVDIGGTPAAIAAEVIRQLGVVPRASV
jgi:carbohydrate kinase (thermoresistant glucokinase family)